MLAKRIRKTGLPPGSLIYTGTQKSEVVVKDLIRYNAEHISNLDPDSLPQPEPNFFYWLDVRGIHKAEEIQAIGEAYNLDILLLEDILDSDQRPKAEMTDHGLLVIFKSLIRKEGSTEFLTEQISFVLTEHRLITFQEHADDTFLPLKIRMQQTSSRLRTRRPDYLMYAIIDFITDHYFPVIDTCSERILLLDMAVNENPSEKLKRSIYHVRKDIAEMNRIIQPTREAVNALLRAETPLITEKTRRYLRDVMDNIMQLYDLNDNQGKQLSSIHDLFMSDMTYRMTTVMKTLTVVTAIFIPLTFLTSVYGMNFKHQDEYNWPWAYEALWAIMILIGVAQLIYFKRKNWL